MPLLVLAPADALQHGAPSQSSSGLAFAARAAATFQLEHMQQPAGGLRGATHLLGRAVAMKGCSMLPPSTSMASWAGARGSTEQLTCRR